MNGAPGLPTLIGSTFGTANAMPAAPIATPPAQPAFQPSEVALHRRMRFNPLRIVTPENLGLAHDNFDLGYLWQAGLFWDAMIRRDDTLSFVVPQLENAIAARPWAVFKKKGADETEAARHVAALEYFYANCTAVNAFDRNERGDRHLLLKQMGSSYAMRYAVHHFVWKREPGKMIEVEGAEPVPALTAELEFVPIWFFENTTGTLRLVRYGYGGGVGEELNWDGEWMVTHGQGLMFAAASCYIFKRLTFQDWTIYNERYGQQKVVGMTNARADSDAGRQLSAIVESFNGDMGIALHECQSLDKPPISLLGPTGTATVDVFEKFLERQDRKMTVMFRGSDLRNMSREKETTGVSAQSDETEALELAHCAAIASACRSFIDRFVIQYCFGEGVEPLAYFGLPEMNDEDAQQLRENAGFIADRGGKPDLVNIADRLGVPLADGETKEEDVLQPLRTAADPEAEDPADPQRTPNARRLSRLQQLVEEALRTQNANPNHDGLGRFARYDGAYASAAAEAAEVQKGTAAMRRAIDSKADVLDAMQRPGVGSIDFIWGSPGGGIRHIVEKRDREGRERKSLAGQTGEEIAMILPEVIAKGARGRTYIHDGKKKCDIEHAGFKAVIQLQRDGAHRAWLLTGFKRT